VGVEISNNKKERKRRKVIFFVFVLDKNLPVTIETKSHLVTNIIIEKERKKPGNFYTKVFAIFNGSIFWGSDINNRGNVDCS
jgi:hypothetical protein